MDALLVPALAAFAAFGTPARISKALRERGPAALYSFVESLEKRAMDELRSSADELQSRGIGACILGAEGYPAALSQIPKPPGVFFYSGNSEILHAPGIGMCGSRNVSPAGLAAATACGTEVAARDMAVFSGYAKGVDTATHLAALEHGGRTAIILAEGINLFRVKKSFAHVGIDDVHSVVVSQFTPNQRWTVGAAMTRNAVIAGLGQALVVIEAGEKGGTLNAGLQALKMGRRVMALQFTRSEMPAGNLRLINLGAEPVGSRQELGHLLGGLDAPKTQPTSAQLQFG